RKQSLVCDNAAAFQLYLYFVEIAFLVGELDPERARHFFPFEIRLARLSQNDQVVLAVSAYCVGRTEHTIARISVTGGNVNADLHVFNQSSKKLLLGVEFRVKDNQFRGQDEPAADNNRARNTLKKCVFHEPQLALRLKIQLTLTQLAIQRI